LKRLDPEKEMKEHQRTFAASRAFHERERTRSRKLELLQLLRGLAKSWDDTVN